MSFSITPLEVLQRAFPGIPRAESEELARSGKVRFYPPQAVLCREGDPAETFYIILEGQVQVTKEINFENNRILKNLGAGDFFGEMALINDAPRSATVATLTPTTVLEIHKNDFNALVQHSASLSTALAREVSRRLRENDAMAIEDLRVKAGELALAYQKLAEQDYSRRDFLSQLARELRTPLTSATGLLQFIKDDALQGEPLQTALDSVSQNLQQVVSLVNDLLFLQEMEMILLRLQPVDVSLLIQEVVEKQSTRRCVGVQVRVLLPPKPLRVSVDVLSFERAIDAILDNACKFSPIGGEVLVEAQATGGQMTLRIIDQGVGIPGEALPRIFDRFYRTDPTTGSGLGLSIARQVIEQHGGQIFVESQVGLGTTVTVCIPALP